MTLDEYIKSGGGLTITVRRGAVDRRRFFAEAEEFPTIYTGTTTAAGAIRKLLRELEELTPWDYEHHVNAHTARP